MNDSRRLEVVENRLSNFESLMKASSAVEQALSGGKGDKKSSLDVSKVLSELIARLVVVEQLVASNSDILRGGGAESS